MRRSPTSNHLILALRPTLLDVIHALFNLIYYHIKIHINLDTKPYFQYDGNLIHHYQEQHQLLRSNLLVMDLNLILQWHHSMSLLVQQIDFDFSANDLINKRLRSLDPFDVVEINTNDPMTKMILDLPVVQLRAMCKPSTSPELKVNIYLMDGTVVMMELSISLKTQWTSG